MAQLLTVADVVRAGACWSGVVEWIDEHGGIIAASARSITDDTGKEWVSQCQSGSGDGYGDGYGDGSGSGYGYGDAERSAAPRHLGD